MSFYITHLQVFFFAFALISLIFCGGHKRFSWAPPLRWSFGRALKHRRGEGRELMGVRDGCARRGYGVDGLYKCPEPTEWDRGAGWLGMVGKGYSVMITKIANIKTKKTHVVWKRNKGLTCQHNYNWFMSLNNRGYIIAINLTGTTSKHLIHIRRFSKR